MASWLLNVDDDEGARYARGRFLREAGFDVRDAATGRGALGMMKDRPDLVVLDLNLPDISGFDVCRRIKSDRATASTPVLHVSAYFISPADRAQALADGADGYLAEPVDPAVLVSTVRSLLRRTADADLLKGARVLAVDDSDDAREMSQMLLGLYGAEVRTAGSTAEALSLIATWSPDVIIADIAMPGEDGYRFIERLRALAPEAGGRIPAIAWTGYVREEDRLRSLRAGYQLHMAKPISAPDLVRAVASVIRRS